MQKVASTFMLQLANSGLNSLPVYQLTGLLSTVQFVRVNLVSAVFIKQLILWASRMTATYMVLSVLCHCIMFWLSGLIRVNMNIESRPQLACVAITKLMYCYLQV